MQSFIRLPLVLAVAMVLSVSGLAQMQKKSNTTAMKSPKKELALVPADNIKWEPIGEEFPGVMVARLYGDSERGGYAIFVKTPPGFAIPKHYHNNDQWGVIVSGEAIITLQDGKEYRFGPGSWLSFPKKVRHALRAGSQGLVFLEESDEKESTILVGEKEMKGKEMKR